LTELLCQGFIGVTDSAEKNVSSLLRGFQVSKLRDGATAQYAYPETVLIFQHCVALSCVPPRVSLPGKSILGAQSAATRAKSPEFICRVVSADLKIRSPGLKSGAGTNILRQDKTEFFRSMVKPSICLPERFRGFEAATERGTDALTRGIRLKARSSD
jgi:hypothetical protein